MRSVIQSQDLDRIVYNIIYISILAQVSFVNRQAKKI